MPTNPVDPDLRRVSLVVNLRVERHSLVYNGIAFDAISSNETVHDRDHSQLIYYHAIYYYEERTSILLHSSCGYRPPNF